VVQTFVPFCCCLIILFCTHANRIRLALCTSPNSRTAVPSTRFPCPNTRIDCKRQRASVAGLSTTLQPSFAPTGLHQSPCVYGQSMIAQEPCILSFYFTDLPMSIEHCCQENKANGSFPSLPALSAVPQGCFLRLFVPSKQLNRPCCICETYQ